MDSVGSTVEMTAGNVCISFAIETIEHKLSFVPEHEKISLFICTGKRPADSTGQHEAVQKGGMKIDPT